MTNGSAGKRDSHCDSTTPRDTVSQLDLITEWLTKGNSITAIFSITEWLTKGYGITAIFSITEWQ